MLEFEASRPAQCIADWQEVSGPLSTYCICADRGCSEVGSRTARLVRVYTYKDGHGFRSKLGHV
jgi:hypothetical protein